VASAARSALHEVEPPPPTPADRLNHDRGWPAPARPDIKTTWTQPSPLPPSIGLRLSRTARQRDRIFTTLLALMALAVLYGFSRSYYFKLAFGTPSLSPLYHLHGVLFTSWLLLLIL
jgi:hypothetical protein